MLRNAAILTAILCNIALPAIAQEVRRYTGTVAVGQEFAFDHWLNYDESTCMDRGFVKITLGTRPTIGKLRMQRIKVSSNSGPCANRRLSAVFLYYRAGKVSGSDAFNYKVQGGTNVSVLATVVVN